VDEPGNDALEQLPLPQHDHRFVANASGHVAEALDRLSHPHQPPEEERAPGEQPDRDGEESGEGERADGPAYDPRAFLSSALIAGTISCRSPMTA
jgi:hypothetical protein